MTVRIEKRGKVWTVIHSRPEARNAMDPESADALVAALTRFDKDPDAAVAVPDPDHGPGPPRCRGGRRLLAPDDPGRQKPAHGRRRQQYARQG